MQSQDIRYDLLVQDALRGMVRDLLIKIAREGLPGDHHFFITYKTHAPGVQLSPRMKARYPEEITIVLQHQFWDLLVNERQFEVGLSFSNIPERLIVPFSALTGFHDPSVPFMLKFEPKEASAAQEQTTEPAPLARITPKPEGIKTARRPGAETAAAPDPVPTDVRLDGQLKPDSKSQPDAALVVETEAAKVVSIDSFRKKP